MPNPTSTTQTPPTTPATAGAGTPSAGAGDGPAGDRRAHALLRAAHERTYRLPAGFAGFRARVRYRGPDGEATGEAEVRSPRDLRLDLEGGSAEGVAWARQELASIVGHRWPSDYAASDGRYRLALGPETAGPAERGARGEQGAAPGDGAEANAEAEADALAPLGTLVRVLDDRFRSSYRLRDGQIAVVDRTMGAVRFAIQVLDRTAAPDGRHVPAHFVVTYWDTESGRLTRADAYADGYAPVGDVLLPAARTVSSAGDGGLAVRSLGLEAHTLLEASGGEPPKAELPKRWSTGALAPAEPIRARPARHAG